jgi:uncharacterized damage-inducible protein DinB
MEMVVNLPISAGESTVDLRYPIGTFKLEVTPGNEEIQRAIVEITEAPARLRAAVEGLTTEQLDTPYRLGGWTVRQVVHHVPDSHLNSYCRFKLALTEDEPTIRAYHEDRWAELEEARSAPIEVSLALLESLHRRWVLMLNSLAPSDFQRTFRHPDMGVVSLAQNVCPYAWHGRHHTAHVTSLREREGFD